jgi:uncharacterized protein (TIGR00269 family)
MAACRKCGGKAEVRVDYARMDLCGRCFTEFYEGKVRETVRKYGMFGGGDRVAVAVSGGKDSAALLFALRRIFPDLSIAALHINVGIPGYSEECEREARRLAEMTGTYLIVYDTARELGITTPNFAGTAYARRICSPCGTVKRYLLNRVAWERGFTKVATGHNLDDVLEVIFSAYVQGDVVQLVRLKPFSPSNHPKLVAKVKPLWWVTEEENLAYAELNGLPFRRGVCPFSPESRSRRRKEILDMIEARMRGFKHTFVSSHLKRTLPALERSVELPPFVECSSCGMPSSENPCAFCRRIEAARRVSR